MVSVTDEDIFCTICLMSLYGVHDSASSVIETSISNVGSAESIHTVVSTVRNQSCYQLALPQHWTEGEVSAVIFYTATVAPSRAIIIVAPEGQRQKQTDNSPPIRWKPLVFLLPSCNLFGYIRSVSSVKTAWANRCRRLAALAPPGRYNALDLELSFRLSVQTDTGSEVRKRRLVLANGLIRRVTLRDTQPTTTPSPYTMDSLSDVSTEPVHSLQPSVDYSTPAPNTTSPQYEMYATPIYVPNAQMAPMQLPYTALPPASVPPIQHYCVPPVVQQGRPFVPGQHQPFCYVQPQQQYPSPEELRTPAPYHAHAGYNADYPQMYFPFPHNSY